MNSPRGFYARFAGFTTIAFIDSAETVMIYHKAPTQRVCVTDCYFVVNVLDLPFASPITIYH